MDPANDPNHHIQQLIANRQKRKEEGGKPPEDGKTDEKKGEEKPKEPPKQLGDLLSNALKFRTKKPEAKPAEDEKADEKPAEEPKTPAAEEKPADPKPAKKTKKAVAPVIDAARIASDAAAQAAAAVVEATKLHQPEPKPDEFEESLHDDDKYRLEVARYLAKTDPRFANADRQTIDLIKKTDAYIDAWQKQNPGKKYNADDEEHEEFYSGLENPLSDHEFKRAAIRMETERATSVHKAEIQKELEKSREHTARAELKPAVEDNYAAVFGAVAQAVDPEALKVLQTGGGWDALAKKDPVLAPILATVVAESKPLLETIVLLGDPKQRVKFNADDPQHQEWGRYLVQKEAEYAGAVDDKGRRFVTRRDYINMNPAQRHGVFYLTDNHLISELADDVSKRVAEEVKRENDRLDAYATARGLVKATATDATKKPVVPNEAREAAKVEKPSEKPVSPSSGGGAKIDEKGGSSGTPESRTLQKTSMVLFGR